MLETMTNHFFLYCINVAINSTWMIVNLLFIACRLSDIVLMCILPSQKRMNEWTTFRISTHKFFANIVWQSDPHTQPKIYWYKRLLLEMVLCVWHQTWSVFPPFNFVDFDLRAYKRGPQQLCRTLSGIIYSHIDQKNEILNEKHAHSRGPTHTFFCNMCAMPRTYRNRWNAMASISKFRALNIWFGWA